MNLKHENVDYDYLLNLNSELAIVVAMLVGENWHGLPTKTYDMIEAGIRLQWIMIDEDDWYTEYLRRLAATALWLLIERDEYKHA